jgi:hypothetical protein
MSRRESDDDSFEHYCVDCKAIVNPYDKICANCGADISKFIEDEDSDEDSVLEAESFFEELLPNEKILSNRRGLTLTTHRIRYQSEVWGSSQIKSIMLEELASCVVTRSSNPVLLVLAALCFLVGIIIATNNRDAAPPLIGALVLASVLVGIYFATRQQILLLESGGTTITATVEVANMIELRGLIDEIEAAKNERYLIVRNSEVVKSVK